MKITPEQARAELQRRKASQITPEMARAELERRENPGTAGDIARAIKGWADGINLTEKTIPTQRGQAMAADFAIKGGANLVADTIQDPLKTWVLDPVNAIKGLPKNLYDSARAYTATPMFDPAILGESAFGGADALQAEELKYRAGLNKAAEIRAANPNAGVNAVAGGLEVAGVVPFLKPFTKPGAQALKQTVKQGLPKAAKASQSDAAAQAIARMAKAEGNNPADINQRLLDIIADEDNPDMLFQSLNMPQTAQGLGNRAGASRDIMQQAARQQQAGQRGRVQDAFRTALDNPDFDASTDAIEALYRDKGSPLYEAAFNATPKPSDAMKKAISNPGIQQRLDGLAGRLANDGVDLSKFQNGQEGRLMQLLKEDLDDEIGRAVRAGASKKAERIRNMRDLLVEGMDESYPGYRQARQTWSQGKQQEKALALGQDIFNADPRDFAAAVSKLPDDGVEFARAGVIRALEKQLDLPESYSAVRAALRKPSFRENISALVGKDKADKLVKSLDEEVMRAETARSADYMRGSKTAPTQQTIAQVDNAVNPATRRGIGRLLNQLNQNGLNPGSYVRTGANKVVKAVNSPDEKLATEIAELLAMPSKQGAEELLRRGFGAQESALTRALADLERRRAISALLAQQSLSGLRPAAPMYAAGVAVNQ